MTALELLSGDARTFRDRIWASGVHLHRTDPTDLGALLSLDDVDHLLTSVALRTPALRLVKDGSVLPASRFTRSATTAGSAVTGLVDARKVFEHFDSGATVVLQGLQRYWPALTGLVRELELSLGHPCQANAYLTPPGSQGFARHSDTHDVFVLQTYGRKQWQIGEGAEEREVVLEPGVSMYLPTGTPHSARSQDTTSLHVTVGINRLTWRQVLRQVTERALADERYAAPLPAGYLDQPDRLATLLSQELAAFGRDVTGLRGEDVAAEHVAGFLRERAPALRGGLSDRVLLDRVDDETQLVRRRTAACLLQTRGDRLIVLLGDRELRMPRRLREPMAFVRDHAAFRVGDLAPWLDEQSRLVVARRLVREGLLRIEQ